MSRILVYLKTIYNLGFLNVLSVLYYRIFTNSLLTKIYFPQKLNKDLKMVFLPSIKKKSVLESQRIRIIKCADSILDGNIYYYCYHKQYVGEKPDWFLNPFNKKKFKGFRRHWSKLNDFNSEFGDIKNFWEISRFHWVGTLIQAYAITLDEKYLEKINTWISDWSKENEPNTGPNWKCGQEASIRVLNLILAQEILNPNTVTNDLKDCLEIHIDRITPTTFYAKAQKNNHGLSEGCALFLAGYFLWKNKKEKKYYSIYQKGLRLIENQVQKLILADGTFSQYSIVYHRMVLDLLSVIELIRQEWDLDSFSELFYEKVNLAIEWYSSMIDPISGNAPNMGANDGTYLFNYDQKEYRDFRPTLLLASALYKKPMSEKIGTSHNLIEMFNIPIMHAEKKAPNSKIFSQGGYLKLVRKDGMALLRVPKYIFRPSHCDALHIDIWQDGINWIRDAGSFSYACNSNELDAFSGTQGHSTIQFDNRNQMPRLSRFLFGSWLKPSNIKFNMKNNTASAGYTDIKNARHERKISKTENGWKVVDKITGDFTKGFARWILKPADWKIENFSIQNENTILKVNSDNINNFKLIKLNESLFYMEKSSVPVLIIGFDSECLMETLISFTS